MIQADSKSVQILKQQLTVCIKIPIYMAWSQQNLQQQDHVPTHLQRYKLH